MPISKPRKKASRAKIAASSGRSAQLSAKASIKPDPKPAAGKLPKRKPERAERSIPPEQRSNFIPEAVSQRMIQRVVLFAGIPTFIGLSSFGINYYLVTRDIVDLPPIVTLVETLALFGLGFVGISYGVLSASWIPEERGSRLGFQEFGHNLGLLRSQWKEAGDQKKASKPKTDDHSSDP